jgi:5,10-methylene-tetrahydrofolate dehydrogenase/methenyl tetrahydrofolate cyclohydrolase
MRLQMPLLGTKAFENRKYIINNILKQLNKEKVVIYDSYFANDRKIIGETIIGTARIENNEIVCDVETEVPNLEIVWTPANGGVILSLEVDHPIPS